MQEVQNASSDDDANIVHSLFKCWHSAQRSALLTLYLLQDVDRRPAVAFSDADLAQPSANIWSTLDLKQLFVHSESLHIFCVLHTCALASPVS